MAPVIDPIACSNNETASWYPITLEKARGFFHYQMATTPVTDSRLQAKLHTEHVPSIHTSLHFDQLDHHVLYSVSVAPGIVNMDNMDLLMATAPPVTLPPPDPQISECNVSLHCH